MGVCQLLDIVGSPPAALRKIKLMQAQAAQLNNPGVE